MRPSVRVAPLQMVLFPFIPFVLPHYLVVRTNGLNENEAVIIHPKFTTLLVCAVVCEDRVILIFRACVLKVG